MTKAVNYFTFIFIDYFGIIALKHLSLSLLSIKLRLKLAVNFSSKFREIFPHLKSTFVETMLDWKDPLWSDIIIIIIIIIIN